MKTGLRVAVILLPPIVFFALLFFSNGVFMGSGNSETPALAVSIAMPLETNDIQFGIEEVKRVSLKGKEVVYMSGWAFKQNLKKGIRKVHLILKTKEETIIYEILQNNISRPDVSSAFKLDQEITSHGFKLNLLLKELGNKPYRIGFIVEDGAGISCQLTDKTLVISEDNVGLGGYKAEFVSRPVNAAIPKPNEELRCFFDTAVVSDGILLVSGWGFIQGLDATSLKTSLLLKSPGKQYAFDIKVLKRKDVNKAYGTGQSNLDSTGFLARVPVDLVNDGKYQLGLCITKDSRAGVFFGKKFVQIRKQ